MDRSADRIADRARVLVVDDDRDTRTILRAILTHSGDPAWATGDGDSALALARLPGVALVIAELYVPHGSGPCVVGAVKRQSETRNARVLVYTAHALPGDRQWAEDSGCDGLLTKPTELGELLREVRRLAGPPRAAARAAASAT